LRKLRDVFYINAFQDNNEIVYYGLEFKEFIKFIPVELDNILFLKSEHYGAGYRVKYNFETIQKDELKEFTNEDIYGYGDFCWVDFDKVESINGFEPSEVAELLYLGHMFLPVNSPFFEKIQNRYVYLAHDDGWFCRLYCRNFNDFGEVIANKVVSMVSTSKRRKIYSVQDELKSQLLSLAESGLLIDFSNVLRCERSIEIPIYTIGKFIDMDAMYNDLRRHIGRARYSAKLVHKNKEWTIDYVQIRS
jgi:hypothetical protein